MNINPTIYNSKLLQLLQTFNKKELKQLDLWLSSPIHNKSEKVIHLYRGLIKERIDKPISKYILLGYMGVVQDKSQAISPTDDLVLRRVMSELTIQIQYFLIWEKSKKNSLNENRLLMDSLIERKLYNLVPAVLLKSRKKIGQTPHNIQYQENLFKITEIEFYLDVLVNNRKSGLAIQEIINTLWQSHLSKVLRYYCAAKNGEKVLGEVYQYPFMMPIKEYIEENFAQIEPISKMYYGLLNLIESEKPEHFYALKQYLFDKLDDIDTTEIRQFFNHLTNYCTRVIRMGRNEFIVEKHELYDMGLRLNIWSTGTHFSAHQFVQITKNALLISKIEWADDFVNRYQHLLAPKLCTDIVNYYYALAAFQRKHFEKAHFHLHKIVNIEDFAYHIDFKILLMKIYYEQVEFSIDNFETHPIHYELEAIRQYVGYTRNKNISDSLREAYINFINIFKRILNRRKKVIFEKKVKKGYITKLKQELLTESPFIEWQWLKEKIEDLE